MTVTGKHREILIELLIYLVGKEINNNDDIKAYYKSIIASIKRQDSLGEYWIEYYIDDEGTLRMN